MCLRECLSFRDEYVGVCGLLGRHRSQLRSRLDQFEASEKLLSLCQRAVLKESFKINHLEPRTRFKVIYLSLHTTGLHNEFIIYLFIYM